MKKELDLSGLRLVYGGLILQLIGLVFAGRLATGLMNGADGSGIAACVIRAAALVIILVGVSRLGEASLFFCRARKPYLAQLIVQILLLIISIALGKTGWSVGDIAQTARNSVIEMLIVAVVLLIVSIIAGLVSVRAMLRGCGHVAEQVNDPLFSIKCIKTWRMWYMAYLLTILVVLAGIAMIVTVLRKTIESGAAGDDLAQAIFTNVTSSALLVSILVMAVLVFFLIAHILYIGKIRTTFREYHRAAVVDDMESGGGEQRPVFADYVQRELDDSPDGMFRSGIPEGGPESAHDRQSDGAEEYREEKAEGDLEGSSAVRKGGADEVKTISGRKYRRIEAEPAADADTEEDTDTDEILEIAKLFKKNRK